MDTYQLQKALKHDAPQHEMPFILQILHQSPYAAQSQLRRGRTMLHVACRASAGPEVIRALIDAYPAALAQKSIYGTTPLHAACAHRAPYATIRLLVETRPESLREVDARGRTPLHLACGQGTWPVRDGAPRRQFGRRLNCGCCLEAGTAAPPFLLPTSFPVVQVLIERYPQAAFMADGDGRTPLNLTAAHGFASRQVRDLLTWMGKLMEQRPTAGSGCATKDVWGEFIGEHGRSGLRIVLGLRPDLVHALVPAERALWDLLHQLGRDGDMSAVFVLLKGMNF